MDDLTHSAALGRTIRMGDDLAELGRSTWAKAEAAIGAGEVDSAMALMQSGRREQQLMMDTMVDWVWAMLTWVQRELDEPAVERILRETLGSWVADRYGNYLDLTFPERIALTLEGMRGHLSGPDRQGEIEVEHHDDRVELRFDPCGSGGNALRGDPARGIPPAHERPELGFSEAAHDWTWNQEGVCLYCTHCALVNEILPIERLGFPLRVTRPPTSPDDSCRWTIYADPRDVPSEAYVRVGKAKPSAEELEAIWAELGTGDGPSST